MLTWTRKAAKLLRLIDGIVAIFEMKHQIERTPIVYRICPRNRLA